MKQLCLVFAQQKALFVFLIHHTSLPISNTFALIISQGPYIYCYTRLTEFFTFLTGDGGMDVFLVHVLQVEGA